MFTIKKCEILQFLAFKYVKQGPEMAYTCDVAEWRHKCRKVYIIQNPITLILLSRFSSSLRQNAKNFFFFIFYQEISNVEKFFIP